RRLRQCTLSWCSGGARYVYPFGLEVFQNFPSNLFGRSAPRFGTLRLRLGFEKYSELLLRIEKGDQEKDDAKDEVGAKRRHEASSSTDQVVMSELPGPQHERNNRLPKAGVEFEQIAHCIAHQFPNADEPSPGALPAAGTVLSLQSGLAIQAEFRRRCPLGSMGRTQHPSAGLEAVAEPQCARPAHLFGRTGQVLLQGVVAFEDIMDNSARPVRRAGLAFEGFGTDESGKLEHFPDVLFEPGVEFIENCPVDTHGDFVDQACGHIESGQAARINRFRELPSFSSRMSFS